MATRQNVGGCDGARCDPMTNSVRRWWLVAHVTKTLQGRSGSRDSRSCDVARTPEKGVMATLKPNG